MYNINKIYHSYDKEWIEFDIFGSDVFKNKETIIKFLEKNPNKKIAIFQLYTSNFLADEIIETKDEKIKSKYMDKDVKELVSKLDEKIYDEWIGWFLNDNKPRTEEFNNRIQQEEEKRRADWTFTTLDDVIEPIMEEYRAEMIKKLGLTDKQVKNWTKPRIDISWRRKYEIESLDEDHKFRWDYRNSLTTIFAISDDNWNYKILGVWGGWWSGQRQTFSEMSYTFYLVIKEMLKKWNRDDFFLHEFYYYNEKNELEPVLSLENWFITDFDLGSNTTLCHDNETKSICEEIKSKYPSITSDFLIRNEEGEIFEKKYYDFYLIAPQEAWYEIKYYSGDNYTQIVFYWKYDFETNNWIEEYIYKYKEILIKGDAIETLKNDWIDIYTLWWYKEVINTLIRYDFILVRVL